MRRDRKGGGMKDVKGVGFGVRFYRRPVYKLQNSKISEHSSENAAPQELEFEEPEFEVFSPPFTPPQITPIHDIPDQTPHMPAELHIQKSETKIVYGFAASGGGAIGFESPQKISARLAFLKCANRFEAQPLLLFPFWQSVFAPKVEPKKETKLELFETWPPLNPVAILAEKTKKAREILMRPMPAPANAPAPQKQTQPQTKTQKIIPVALLRAQESALRKAAAKGDCFAIRVLVMKGVDLDARDGAGRTALNLATQYNQSDAIKTLLAAKEMRRMAKLGELPQGKFFKKFKVS